MARNETTSTGTGLETATADVVLIGGGVVSATVAALLARLQPDWSITVLERLDRVAEESSGSWNNAGTGHAGLCELNYMPNPDDAARTEEIGRQFQLSRQLWAALVADGTLPNAAFVSPVPHMNVVFGERDVTYLRRRYATLARSPLFAAMRYTEDPEVVRRWAPLLMDGRIGDEPVAATRHEAGVDVDFGALTRALTEAATERGVTLRTGHEVTGLSRAADGRWTVTGRRHGPGRGAARRFRVSAGVVVVGAGGHALRLLQKARLPEVRGYAVFPIGAQFLRTDTPDVVARHAVKVYGRAAVGAPPMSVPHLDLRVVDGHTALMFGPYASFSTRLLRHGRLVDFFTTLRWHNLMPLLAVGAANLPLVRYLVGELMSSRKRKLMQLRRFHPGADPRDWRLVHAGQRAQLITPDPRRIGVLTFGTELVTGADGTIAGVLGASPGASIAPSVAVDLLAACFPRQLASWEPTLRALVPGLGNPVDADRATADDTLARTGGILGLTRAAQEPDGAAGRQNR